MGNMQTWLKPFFLRCCLILLTCGLTSETKCQYYLSVIRPPDRNRPACSSSRPVLLCSLADVTNTSAENCAALISSSSSSSFLTKKQQKNTLLDACMSLLCVGGAGEGGGEGPLRRSLTFSVSDSVQKPGSLVNHWTCSLYWIITINYAKSSDILRVWVFLKGSTRQNNYEGYLCISFFFKVTRLLPSDSLSLFFLNNCVYLCPQ